MQFRATQKPNSCNKHTDKLLNIIIIIWRNISSGHYPRPLLTHLKSHSGEKSNKCNQCDYASSEASSLRTFCHIFGAWIIDGVFLRRLGVAIQNYGFAASISSSLLEWWKWSSAATWTVLAAQGKGGARNVLRHLCHSRTPTSSASASAKYEVKRARGRHLNDS